MTEASQSVSSDPSADGAPLPPGPDGLPVLGSTIGLIRDPLEFLRDAATYGDVVRYRIAGLPFTAIFHPSYVEDVLVSDAPSFERWTGDEWNVISEFAPEGLLLTDGAQWRSQRLAIQPAFTPDRIQGYADAMVEYTADMADSWADGETLALNRETSRLTLRVLAKTLFDLDIAGRDDVVTRAATAVNDRADSRNLSTFLPGWVPTPARRRSRRAVAAMERTVDDLIAARRDQPDAYTDLLSLLLTAEDEAGEGMTDREVKDNMTTFLFAGHETTSLALTYAFFLLARHPEKRAALDDEVETVLDGDRPTVADLPDMPYTEQVVNETLRMYPPAYVMFREALEDATIGGYRIPAGTKLTIPPIVIHRDERFFDDPDAFRPSRWTDAMEEALPEYAYFPFGGGPRHCIGMRFAMMELRLAIPTIAQRVSFDLESDADLDFQLGVTLQPAEDIDVRVRRR